MNESGSEQPKPYQRFIELYPEAGAAYEKLGKACHGAGPLEPKIRELIKLGISIGAGLEGAAHAHVRLALDSGASEEEIRHAVLLATTTIGFPSMNRALTWVNDVLEP
jgi:alkylhydroperoxidase/carboxymuconolactone decarboxylase family protein YurZ